MRKQVPNKCYIGSCLEGITIQIVDENGDLDDTVDGQLHSLTLDWMKNVTCPFNKGECVLPPVNLPTRPGLWTGTVSLFGNENITVNLEVYLELAFASRLGPVSFASYEGVLSAQCGETFMFPFGAFDTKGQPALLSEAMLARILVKAEAARGAADGELTKCEFNITRKGSENLYQDGYHADVILAGRVGSYILSLVDTDEKLEVSLKVRVSLGSGQVVKIQPVSSEDIFKELGHSIPNPLLQLEVPRFSEFPRMIAVLVDCEDNLCTSYEGENVVMQLHTCPQSTLLQELVTSIKKGCCRFEPFKLNFPVGTYSALIKFMPSVTSKIFIRVKPGNYPVGLAIPDDQQSVEFCLTAEQIHFLPQMDILVMSADELPLKESYRIGLSIRSTDGYESGRLWYGEPLQVGSSRVQAQAGVGRYSFNGVVAPTKAGKYDIEYFLENHDNVPGVSQALYIKHGPPSRLEFAREKLELEELTFLKVKLVDDHGNQCSLVSGQELIAKFELLKDPASGVAIEGTITGPVRATVHQGLANFGQFEAHMHKEGLYRLTVNDASICLSSVQVEILVTCGSANGMLKVEIESMASRANALRNAVKVSENARKQCSIREMERQELLNGKKKLEDELSVWGSRRHKLRSQQVSSQDEQQLLGEQNLGIRLEETVIQEMRKLSNQAPLAFWEACLPGNFLSLESGNPAASDTVGVLVMLARVESKALNRILSEFLGLSNLLLLVCKTQSGVKSIEEYDKFGKVIETRGLHGFALKRRYQMSGRFDILTLQDIRHKRFRGDIDLQHPQKLLKINPPCSQRNQVPEGFLGYAVNLLHLKEEHLRIEYHGAGLRESLFFNLLGTLQVYDSREHMLRSKELLLQFHDGAISLDGGLIRRGSRQSLGLRRDHLSISFPNVPYQERISCSLMPPTNEAFKRLQIAQNMEREIECGTQKFWELEKNLQEVTKMIEAFQATLARVQAGEPELFSKPAMISARVGALEKVYDALVGRPEAEMHAYLLESFLARC